MATKPIMSLFDSVFKAIQPVNVQGKARTANAARMPLYQVVNCTEPDGPACHGSTQSSSSQTAWNANTK